LEYTMEAALSPAYWDRKVAAVDRASSREGTTGALALVEARAAASKLDAAEVLLTISMSSSIEAPRADDDDDDDDAADLVLACTNGDRGRFPRLACAAAADEKSSPEKGDGEANAAAVLDARCREETAPPARRLVGLRLLIDLLGGVCAGDTKAVTPPPEADAARNTARANFGSFILPTQKSPYYFGFLFGRYRKGFLLF